MSERQAARPSGRPSKTERWLNLLAFLLDHRRPVPREEILSQVEDYKSDWVGGSAKVRESVRRKFERDKAELKELGVIIEPLKEKVLLEHSNQEVEAYQLKPRDFYLPYLKTGGPRTYFLNEVPLSASDLPILRRAAERIAALKDSPLGIAAESAVRKLAFDLPELHVGAEERAFAMGVDQNVFEVLRTGVEQRRAARCRYYTIGRDTEASRVIEPYGLMLSWGHWYCVARHRSWITRPPSPQAERGSGGEVRVFRLDRMQDVQLIDGDEGDFTVPRDFKIGTYLNRAPWELSDEKPVTVRVRIEFPQSRWVIGERLGKVVKAVTDDAGSEFEFAVRAADAFIRWLLPLGNHVQVLSPPSFKKRLEQARAQLRAIYR